MRLMVPELELVAVRVPGPPAPVHVDVVVVRPRRAVVARSIGLFLQAVEGAVAVGGLAQGVAAVARGGGVGGGRFGPVRAAPDDADEEGAQGGEASGHDGYGGFGGGPDGDGDVVPCCVDGLVIGRIWWGGVGRACDVFTFAVLMDDDEAGYADGADAG